MLFLRVGLFFSDHLLPDLSFMVCVLFRSTFWVTCSFSVFFYGLRAPPTQYRFTNLLGR